MDQATYKTVSEKLIKVCERTYYNCGGTFFCFFVDDFQNQRIRYFYSGQYSRGFAGPDNEFAFFKEIRGFFHQATSAEGQQERPNYWKFDGNRNRSTMILSPGGLKATSDRAKSSMNWRSRRFFEEYLKKLKELKAGPFVFRYELGNDVYQEAYPTSAGEELFRSSLWIEVTSPANLEKLTYPSFMTSAAAAEEGRTAAKRAGQESAQPRRMVARSIADDFEDVGMDWYETPSPVVAAMAYAEGSADWLISHDVSNPDGIEVSVVANTTRHLIVAYPDVRVSDNSRVYISREVAVMVSVVLSFI